MDAAPGSVRPGRSESITGLKVLPAVRRRPAYCVRSEGYLVDLDPPNKIEVKQDPD